ncbi:MAG TPA: hypothetical protein PKU97_12745 [Kofleriaceae bacterium]|nr:hypothetical protein [Kofleriaceae bacterium]
MIAQPSFTPSVRDGAALLDLLVGHDEVVTRHATRGLLARLAALQARHGASVGRAARALDTVDDDELRVWVAELEAQLEACLDGPGAVARTALVSAAASGEGARE